MSTIDALIASPCLLAPMPLGQEPADTASGRMIPADGSRVVFIGNSITQA